MTMIRVIGDSTTWPYSLSQLRLDEPTRSFSNAPSDADLAHYGVFRIATAEPPLFDPATERIVEINPELIDGVWVQRWEVITLTEAEQEAYYRAQNPPEWIAFGQAVQADPGINALLAAALAAAPALAMSLSVGLGQAAQGDDRVFLVAWQAAQGAGFVGAELVTGIRAMAEQYHLPAAFIAGLG
jgi:hypothetical protein